jgi:RND family efflux transporter MFP subunit
MSRWNWGDWHRWLIVPPLAVGVVVIFWLARSGNELPRVEADEKAIPVEVMKLQRTPVRPSATGYGVAKPKRVWMAVAEVAGTAVELHPKLRDGNEVTAGSLLVKIDPTDYQLRVEQRISELNQARSQLDQLVEGRRADEQTLEIQQSLLEVRRSDVERLRQLRGNSAASQSEADLSQAAYLQQAVAVQELRRRLAVTPAQIDAAKAAVRLAEAKVSEARRDLERTEITAPFRGLLSQVNLERGQFVSARESLFELLDVETIEIEARFSIAQLHRLIDLGNTEPRFDAREPATSTVEPSGRATSPLETPAEPESGPVTIGAEQALAKLEAVVLVRSGNVNLEFLAKPVRISGQLDERTRTLGVIVEVTSGSVRTRNRSVVLRSGAYCEVILASEQAEHELVVPRSAVEQGRVYLVDEQNRLSRRQVRTRFVEGDRVVIDGLSEGDWLVVDPPVGALDDALVDPTPIEPTWDTATRRERALMQSIPQAEGSSAGGEGEERTANAAVNSRSEKTLP